MLALAWRTRHSARVSAVASDALEAAVAAADSALADLGDVSDRVVLHASNSVVVGSKRLVAKVTRNATTAQREYVLSRHAEENQAPALAPISSPITIGNFTIVVWPRVDSATAVDRAEAARTLRAVHNAWQDFEGLLPTLADRIGVANQVVTSGLLTAVLDSESVQRLTDAVIAGIDIARNDQAERVLHCEPHDSNFLRDQNRAVAIDFEAACLGSLEWDAAYFPHEVVDDVWPDADRALVDQFRTVLSATVSIYCWRHLAVRGPDEFMLTHAEHHLARVMAART